MDALINALVSYTNLPAYEIWGLYLGGSFAVALVIRDYLARKGFRV